MQTLKIASMALRASGITALVLGVLLWMGVANAALTPFHKGLGYIVVISLWVLAVVAARSHLYGLAAAGIVWGLIVAGLGGAQVKIMPGASHWVIQVVHLIVGGCAIGLGEAIAKRVRLRRGVVPT